MNEFTIEGFNHISAAGVAQLWQYLELKGTIDLLYDMKPMDKINELMQSENFDLDAHIKTNYCDHDSKVYNYDDIVAEFIDEMLETIITLEYCFIYDVYSIDFKGKSIKNLDAIPSCGEWNPNVYLPVKAFETFQNMNEVAGFCIENFSSESDIGEITVRVNADINPDDSSDGQEPQSFEYRVTGAGDCNILTEITNNLIEWGYTVTFTRIK